MKINKNIILFYIYCELLPRLWSNWTTRVGSYLVWVAYPTILSPECPQTPIYG